ncbi:hypothetical protein [Peterkaempfera bronchialis]|uniref:hypothetical protein n=1 Tax=Peterkaempfera bronchialis TaxID=2126346 RepID=UPI003C2DC0B6
MVAAAGYRAWPQSVAHLSVLVAPHCRGRGLARAVASSPSGMRTSAPTIPMYRSRSRSWAVSKARHSRSSHRRWSTR